jgi:hypothetical protein
MARLRLEAFATACSLAVALRTFNQQYPRCEKIDLHIDAQPTWFSSFIWSYVDPKWTLGVQNSYFDLSIECAFHCGSKTGALEENRV